MPCRRHRQPLPPARAARHRDYAWDSDVGRAIDLLKLLDLEPIEVNLFRGISPKSKWPRVFGGQVIGQAMVAACRTVEERLPHSLHAYFILAGDPTVPIIYEVGRLRTGEVSPRGA